MKDRDGNKPAFIAGAKDAVARLQSSCGDVTTSDGKAICNSGKVAQFVAGEVTDEMIVRAFNHGMPHPRMATRYDKQVGMEWLEAWRSELGPALGLVTRDELTIRDTEIARLETDLELARINAARYFWLRDDWYLSGTEDRCLDEVLDLTHRVTPAKMDAAIDEARAGNGGGA